MVESKSGDTVPPEAQMVWKITVIIKHIVKCITYALKILGGDVPPQWC